MHTTQTIAAFARRLVFGKIANLTSLELLEQTHKAEQAYDDASKHWQRVYCDEKNFDRNMFATPSPSAPVAQAKASLDAKASRLRALQREVARRDLVNESRGFAFSSALTGATSGVRNGDVER